MEENVLPIEIIYSRKIRKDIRKLSKSYKLVNKDVESLVARLQAGEIVGDRISGNKYNVFKARVRNSNINKGKSAGYRTIYYTVTTKAIFLTTIYSKSERENISNQEIEDIIEQDEELWAAIGASTEQSGSAEPSDSEPIAEIEPPAQN
jgi:mRNA-degrading endonuclease RelE of RelBE toxin-antitoxin system